MKRIFYLFLFVSFLFLFIYLVRQEVIIPAIGNWYFLLGSFICLFAGFCASAFSWKVALRSHGFSHSGCEALVSHGLSVFAKYIPGKIWVILGRAGYLSRDRKDLKNRTFVSLKEQLVYLWAGFLVSALPTMVYYGFQWISYLVVGIIAGLTLFLFSGRVNRALLSLFHRIFSKQLEVPPVNLRRSLPMIGAVSLIWLCWIAGFYLFMRAFSADITPVMMFAFPLSVSLGLVAIVLPGGIGLREGIIIGYLTLAGLQVETATTISFVGRLWFICGEVFIFLLAALARAYFCRRSLS